MFCFVLYFIFCSFSFVSFDLAVRHIQWILHFIGLELFVSVAMYAIKKDEKKNKIGPHRYFFHRLSFYTCVFYFYCFLLCSFVRLKYLFVCAVSCMASNGSTVATLYCTDCIYMFFPFLPRLTSISQLWLGFNFRIHHMEWMNIWTWNMGYMEYELWNAITYF